MHLVVLSLVSLFCVWVPSASFVHPTFGIGPTAHTVTTASLRPIALYGVSTVEAPTRERTDSDRKSFSSDNEDDDDDEENVADNGHGDLEYLQDSASSREWDDPFHILLMGSTFEKPKITVTYVSGSLEYVLSMPQQEARELSQFAHDEGMSCLGTWSRQECLTLGKQLQVRDIVCRVVPYAEGGQRGWQAKDVNDNASRKVADRSTW